MSRREAPGSGWRGRQVACDQCPKTGEAQPRSSRVLTIWNTESRGRGAADQAGQARLSRHRRQRHGWDRRPALPKSVRCARRRNAQRRCRGRVGTGARSGGWRTRLRRPAQEWTILFDPDWLLLTASEFFTVVAVIAADASPGGTPPTDRFCAGIGSLRFPLAVTLSPCSSCPRAGCKAAARLSACSWAGQAAERRAAQPGAVQPGQDGPVGPTLQGAFEREERRTVLSTVRVARPQRRGGLGTSCSKRSPGSCRSRDGQTAGLHC